MSIYTDGTALWETWHYQFPPTAGQDTQRVIYFGLFSGCWLAGYRYLTELTDWELLILADLLASGLADLDAERVKLLIEIAAKEYFKGLEIAIKDAELEQKKNKLLADKAGVQAQIDGLAADRAALRVLSARLAAAITEAAARIAELKAQIEMEEYRQAEIDLEKARLELQGAETDLAILRAQQDVTEWQVKIAEAAIDLIQSQMAPDEWEAKTARLAAEIAEKGLISFRLDAARAEAEADEARLDADKEGTAAAQAQVDGALARKNALLYERDNIWPQELAMITEDGRAELMEKLLQAETRIDETWPELQADLRIIAAELEAAVADQARRIADAQQRGDLAQAETAARNEIAELVRAAALRMAEKRRSKNPVRESEAGLDADLTLVIARILATASISNRLTHTIGTSG